MPESNPELSGPSSYTLDIRNPGTIHEEINEMIHEYVDDLIDRGEPFIPADFDVEIMKQTDFNERSRQIIIGRAHNIYRNSLD